MDERLGWARVSGRRWRSGVGLLLTLARLNRLANYLYPFLEAEVAAKAIDVVGSESFPFGLCCFVSFWRSHQHPSSLISTAPQSTFSGYTAGTLHSAYLRMGITTEQVSGSASPASASLVSDKDEALLEENLREMDEEE